MAHLFQDFLEELYLKYRNLKDGEVATYIPELTKADPDWFSICVVTVDEQVFEVGDSSQLFTIQSISKIFYTSLTCRWTVPASYKSFQAKIHQHQFKQS